MVVLGSAISDKPEHLIIMDPVLRDFFAVEGDILILHKDEILFLVLSRLVCWDTLYIGNVFSLLWLHLLQSC